MVGTALRWSPPSGAEAINRGNVITVACNKGNLIVFGVHQPKGVRDHLGDNRGVYLLLAVLHIAVEHHNLEALGICSHPKGIVRWWTRAKKHGSANVDLGTSSELEQTPKVNLVAVVANVLIQRGLQVRRECVLHCGDMQALNPDVRVIYVEKIWHTVVRPVGRPRANHAVPKDANREAELKPPSRAACIAMLG